MKRIILYIVFALLLCGCGAEETFETVADEWAAPAMVIPREISVSLPGETTVSAMESDTGRFYFAEDYEVCIQTLPAGDLSATIQTVSGYAKEDLTVMETQTDLAKRYEFVWVSAGEKGERIGRGVVLDDGDYHYVMTVLRDAETTETSQIGWHDVFRSFCLV